MTTGKVKEQLEEILSKTEVDDLLQMVNPWLEEIAAPTEEEGRALQAAFQRILSNVPMPAAMFDAFVLGQAWERAMMNRQ